MQLDIKKAIKSPFNDKKWVSKLIFPSIAICLLTVVICEKPYFHKLLTNIPFFLSLTFFVVLFISEFILSGLFLQIRHNFICDIKQYPDLKGHLGGYFLNGFASLIIYLTYTLAEKLLELISNVPTGGFISLILGIFLLCAYIILLISGSFSQNIYANSFYFSKAFDYKKIFSLISKVKKEIFIYFVFFSLSILCCMLILFPIALLGHHWQINIVYFMAFGYPTISFGGVILILILYNLQAQIYNIAKYRLEKTKTELTENII